MGFPGGCLLVPRGHTTASPASRASLGSLQHPGCWHNLPAGLKQKRGRTPARPTGSPGLAVHSAPRGEGRRLTFSRNSSEPSSRTVMSFWLQDLRAPAHGCLLRRLLRHVTRCGWHRCPARGLALDRQHPGSLGSRHGACVRRVPHQPTVGPHSSPLLPRGQVRRVRHGDIPPALAGAPSAAPRATPVPFLCGTPSAWALQSLAERLLGRGLGSCHGFLAASSSTRLEPKAC